MIIKIQRPLDTNAAESPALIYDESREFEAFVPFAWVEPLFNDDDLKVYAMAELKGTMLVIDSRIKDQAF